MVPWDVCIMPKDKRGLGSIDVATHKSILVAMWVVRCLEGSFPSQVLLRHWFLSMQHIGKIKGGGRLCDIMSAPHRFQISSSSIFRSIWSTSRKVTR